MKKLSVVVLAALTAFSGVLPAGAAPFIVAPKQHATQTADVQEVQYRRDDRGRDRRPDYRRGPPRHGWYNGHRGYRDRRPGYRRGNDGWWYPLAAFTAGAIIGGAIANPGVAAPPPRRGLSQPHVDWCSSRYRTYRVFDNTYVPQIGVRAQCFSPYR